MFRMQNVISKQVVINSVAAVLTLFLVKSAAQNNIARTGHWHGMGKPVVNSKLAAKEDIDAANVRITKMEDYQIRTGAAFTDIDRRLHAIEENQEHMRTGIDDNRRQSDMLVASHRNILTGLGDVTDRVGAAEKGLMAVQQVADAARVTTFELHSAVVTNIYPRLKQVEVAASKDQDADLAKDQITAMIAAEKQKAQQPPQAAVAVAPKQ